MAGASVRIFRLTNRHGKNSLLFQLSSQPAQPAQHAWKQQQHMCARISTSACCSQAVSRTMEPNETFWKKNERMQRPMSPHVTIYRFPIIAWMSITNRVTGAAWSLLIAGAGVSALVLPGDLSTYVAAMNTTFPYWMVASTKFILVWPLAYHTVNGVRHLVWDYTVLGLTNRSVVTSGAVVGGISLLATIGILAYCNCSCS